MDLPAYPGERSPTARSRGGDMALNNSAQRAGMVPQNYPGRGLIILKTDSLHVYHAPTPMACRNESHLGASRASGSKPHPLGTPGGLSESVGGNGPTPGHLASDRESDRMRMVAVAPLRVACAWEMEALDEDDLHARTRNGSCGQRNGRDEENG